MTVRTPPTFLQAGSHTAENTRLLAHGLLRSTPSSFAGGVAAADPGHGVARIGDLGVTANGTPNMSVNVAAGGCFIRGTQSASQGVYHVFNDATVNLSISTANATNPRRDLIVMQVRDSGYAGANDDARLLVVTGTPASSPADPTVPADCLVLARVAVAANATTIVSGNITDLRTYAYGQSQTPTFASTSERDTYLPTPVDGMVCYINSNDANEGLYTYNGTSWRKGPGWNAPWGYLTQINGSAINTVLRAGSSSASVDFVSGSYTHVNNRRVRVTAVANGSWTTGSNTAWRLQQGSTNIAYADHAVTGTLGGSTSVGIATTDGTSQTYAFTLLFGVAVSNVTITALVPKITLEDIGPSGAPV